MATRNAATGRSNVGNTLDIGPCLLFDGSTQEATIPNSAAYSIPTTGKLTISIWARPDADPMPNSNGTGFVDFFNKNETGGSFHEWCFRWTNTVNTETNLRGNEQDFYVFAATGGLGLSPIAQQSQYYLGNWWLYTATADGNYAQFFMNGQRKSSFANRILYSGSITPSATTAILRVARSVNNPSYFKGAIGPIKIWNRVLSDGEITRQYETNESNTTGLVGSWTADQANNRLTDSVSGNNGTLVNSPTFISGLAQKRNPAIRTQVETTKSLVLNGTTQYASIANATQTGLSVGTGDFMVCFRAQIAGRGTTQTFIDMHDTTHAAPNTAGATGWDIIWNSNGNIQFRQGDGSTTGSSNYNVPIFDNQFHDIALVSARNFGTGVSQVWVDGIKIGNNSGGPTGSWTSNGAFRIGTREDTTTQFLNGNVKNVYFFTWSKIADNYFDAIEDLHNLQTTAYTNGLVSKWLMNGDANDSFGPNNLTLTGSPTFVALPGRSSV